MIGDNNIDARRRKLSSSKRAVLEQWREGKLKDTARTAPGISKHKKQGADPLSFAQQRLWFLNQLQSDNTSYNISLTFHLSGPFQIWALDQSIREIVRRHEILRTRFSLIEGQPMQHVFPFSSLPSSLLTIVDLRTLSSSQQELVTRQLSVAETHHLFDLSYDLLLRGTIMRLSANKHVLLISMHHIASDGWSLGVLQRELSSLYTAFCAGNEPSLPDLPIQYTDYVYWQRQWLQDEILDEQLTYWRKQLMGLRGVDLPTNFPRPKLETFDGARLPFVLPPNLLNNLRALSQREGVTLFVTLLAAFQIILMRYSGHEDIVVGTPVANRGQTTLEDLIGLFVNMLVLRTDLAGDPTFLQVLHNVRDTALDAYAHQDLPFERLVEELQPERDLSRSPLFQIFFQLQNIAQQGMLALPDVTVQRLDAKTGITRFDLEMHLFETPAQIIGYMEYKTQLYTQAFIQRMLNHFRDILQEMVSNPEQHISAVPLLTHAERDQLLFAWNATQAAYPSQEGMHTLFEQQAQRTADAIALVSENEHLTYHALQHYSQQVASALQKQGVGPGVFVGLALKRSLLLPIGLLGILKAGGAYVPLDPDYPYERLLFMLQDAQIGLVITQQTVLERLPTYSGTFLYLEDLFSSAMAEPPPPLSIYEKFSSRQPAYVIYTSGSTGIPKGVLLPHEGVVNFLISMRDLLHVESQDSLLALTTLSFDIAVLELFLPLIAGARVYLINSSIAHDGTLLAERLREHAITVMQATPATWRLLLASDWTGEKRLKMLCGGEALPSDLAQSLLSRGKELWNLYGPTETTIWSTAAQITALSNEVCIGRPISNTQIYLLDRHGLPVPEGVIGEIVIGGTGVAAGYFRHPGLTAERFIPDSFSLMTGARLYKTGDLARYRNDKQLEYLGRIDQQIKVRGYRIEPGEIEAVLVTHESIQQAAVLLRKREDGDTFLVAYLIRNGEETSSVHALQAYLSKKLPEYMVPTHFIFVETFPLTLNGKVDRQALSNLTWQEHTPGETEYSAPGTATESQVVEIWKQILKRDFIGIRENFFALGGHSLLAIKVIARLRENLNIEVPVQSIFEMPTVEKLSSFLEQKRRETQRPLRSQFQVTSHGEYVPLSFGQQRLWVLEQLVPSSPVYNLPLVLRLQGMLNTAALKDSLKTIVQRHEVLRTTFTTVDNQPVQVVAPVSALQHFEVPIFDLSIYSDEEKSAYVTLEVRTEIQKPFDLARDLLLRARLLKISEQEHILTITMHHIASDGWSWSIVLNELTTLYAAQMQRQSAALPALPLQYADYALWQRQRVDEDDIAEQLAYWQRQLAGIAPVSLPTDYPRPTRQHFKGTTYSFQFSMNLLKSLQRLSQQEHCTLFMTLLASFQVLLWRYTGQDDIAIGSPTAGRTHQELENLIGFFINTLVLRCNLSGNPTFQELLQQTRRVTLDAYTYQEVPIEKVLEILHPARGAHQLLILPAAFALQSQEPPQLRMPGLTLQGMMPSTQTTKLDLSLFVWESAQGLAGQIEYSTELFKEETIVRMVEQWQQILQQIVADPHQHISNLPPFSWQLPHLAQQVNDVSDVKVKRREEMFETLYQRSNLTRGQLLFWLGQQFQPEVPLYHSCGASTFHMAIDYPAYQQAFQTLVDSSDALRTVIEEKGGIPQQRVLDWIEVPVGYLDFSQEPDPHKIYRTWVRQYYQRPFKLNERLFETTLVKLGEQEHIGVWNVHHMLTDTWSASLVLQWVSRFYQEAVAGKQPERAELPLYAAYVIQERANEATERGVKTRAYWEEKVAQAPPPLALYGEEIVKRETHMLRLKRELGEERTHQLIAWTRQIPGATKTKEAGLFTLLASLLGAYLWRRSGNNKVAIAVPVHNRRGQQAKETIGLFMAALPLYLEIDGRETLLDLMSKVNQDLLQLMRYGHYAVSNPAERKVYDTVLNYQTAVFPDFAGHKTHVEVIDGDHSNESLIVQLHDFGQEDKLILEVALHKEVYEQEWQRQQLIDDLIGLLDRVEENTERPVREWSWPGTISQTETQTRPLENTEPLLEKWNALVLAGSDRVAVVCEQEQYTYGALDSLAEQIAGSLQQQRNTQNLFVAISMKNGGVTPLIGLLGILKAGGTGILQPQADEREQVALPSTVPAQVLQSMHILTESPLHFIHENESLALACSDQFWDRNPNFVPGIREQMIGWSHEALGQAVAQWQAAILIETIEKEHEQFIASYTIADHHELGHLKALIALCAGARIIYLTRQRLQEQWIAQSSYGMPVMLQLSTTLLQALQKTPDNELMNELPVHSIITSPEMMERNSFQQLRTQRWEAASLVADWSEVSAVLQWTRVEHVQGPEILLQPAMPGTCRDILDARGQTTMIGVPGQLVLSGEGSAHSILEGEKGSIYASDLLARWRSGGYLEWIGRLDKHDLKNGYRSMRRYIEAHLLQHYAVEDVVVRWQHNESKEKILVAYIESAEQFENAESAQSTGSDVKRWLRERVPAYWLPEHVVWLQKLPLRESGMVDEEALRQATMKQSEGSNNAQPFVAPRSSAEKIIAAIWAELLGTQDIGIYDDFFELGGHSLLAIQIITRIRDTFRVELALQSLFEIRTIAGLLEEIATLWGGMDVVEEVAQTVLELEHLSEEEITTLLSED